MKIRCDYVTNSSSSSFILGFKDKKSVMLTLEAAKSTILSDGFVSASEKDYERLVKDCKKKGKGIEAVLKEAEWEFEDRAGWKNYLANEDHSNCWPDMEKNKEDAKKSIDEFREKAKDNTYFVYVEYDDHETALDYTLRETPFTLEYFSHH